jgi:hypothetical protein
MAEPGDPLGLGQVVGSAVSVLQTQEQGGDMSQTPKARVVLHPRNEVGVLLSVATAGPAP